MSNRFPVHVPRGAHEFSRERRALSEQNGRDLLGGSRGFAWYRLRNCASEQQVESRMSAGMSLFRRLSKTWKLLLLLLLSLLPSPPPPPATSLSGMWKPSWCRLKFRMAGRVKKFRELPSLPRIAVSSSCIRRSLDAVSPRVKCSDARIGTLAIYLWSQLVAAG